MAAAANNKAITVKLETIQDTPNEPNPTQIHNSPQSLSVIELSSSDSDSDNASIPPGFLDPLPVSKTGSKQFWKAGDYEGSSGGDWNSCNGGMDHVRVHPKFLHSNATSHKWVLGAFAELLDNSLDEVCNGATYVNIDMVKSKRDGSKMLLIEDDGGGMDPSKMRHCMSLGYSAKSKMINTIGQYGNGFKTSTMRLGADVIVFSRNPGKDERPTQSIGLLSYTFLKSTGKEDIVVPMLDYEKRGQNWNKMVRSSAGDWDINVETIVKWSPFSNEINLLRQFNHMKDHGTRIFIYNLWEDDEGLLELDFDTDPHDIQIRGVNRDEKSIEMSKKFPNSKHFLTYNHSLRSYAAILYLRVPPSFRIILRGKDIEHHNIVNDMMMSQEIVYRPQSDADGISKDSNMVAVVTVGFVKDAKFHIDVQGFNVYHKNRLIKPFWRVWHPPGSQGRGVIGVLEANFVEPAHDKQGFERTTVLARLETKLMQAQKNYWTKNSEKIGYAPANNKKSRERDTSFDPFAPSPQSKKKSISSSAGKAQTKVGDKGYSKEHHLNEKDDVRTPRKRPSYAEQFSADDDSNSDDDDDRQNSVVKKRILRSSSTRRETAKHDSPSQRPVRATRNNANSKDDSCETAKHDSPSQRTVQATRNSANSKDDTLSRLTEENNQLRERLKKKEERVLGDLLQDLQKEIERGNSLEAQVEEANIKNEELSKEQEAMIEIFAEERQRRDTEEENLRKKLKDASNMIKQLFEKVESLEKR